MNYKFLVGILLCLLLIGGAQAVTWTSASGCWTATDGEYSLVMWNATGSSSWSPPVGVTTAEFLVVAGAGSGGGSDGGYSGGGGAAGGVRQNSATKNFDISGTVGITVGAGGTGSTTAGNNGGNSVIQVDSGTTEGTDLITAHGGGKGGYIAGGSNGGSGGGGNGYTTSLGGNGTTTDGQVEGLHGGKGYATPEYVAGGGGGQSTHGLDGNTVAHTAGDGGDGYDASGIYGSAFTVAAGGGGAIGYGFAGTTAGNGGSLGLGGHGGEQSAGIAGAASTGSGGGGGSYTQFSGSIWYVGGNGASGVIIIKYQTPSPAPVASFTSTNKSVATNVTEGWEGVAPFTMQLTNTSTNPPHTSFVWNATNVTGNNVPFTFNETTFYNPIYTFRDAGNYTIELNVTNAYGTNISTQITYVNVTSSFDANFIPTPDGGQIPLLVTFADTTAGFKADSWNWSFGDSTLSTLQNPTHTYTAAATNHINLTVRNITYDRYSTKLLDLITNATLHSDFVGAPLTGTATTDVSFVDFSVGGGIYSWDWTFGDGGTSTERNPTHPYSTAGTFDVTLTVDGADGTNTTTMLNYITITEAFDINPDSTYRFKPDTNIIRNITLYIRTIEMGNVNNATYAVGSTLFDKDNIWAVRVLANATTYGDIVLTSYSMDNTTGIVNFNVTRPGGFAPIATFVPIVDVEMLYYGYTEGVTGAGWGSGDLINGTYRNSFPVTHLNDTPLTYSWTTFSNFSVSNNAPIIFEDTVIFTPIELNFTPNRWLWDFGDGNTTLLTTPSSIAHIYSGTPSTLNPSLTAYLIENTSVTNTTILYGAIVTAYNTSYVKADFSATPITGTPGVAVLFTDLSQWGSTDAVSGRTYNWSFGDGLYSSTPYSDVTGDVLHVYPTVGVYSVNLTVNNTVGYDHEEKLNYITVAISQVQQTTWYAPKQIGITAVYRDPAGISIPNTTLTLTAIGSSIPATATTSTGESLQALYGINPTATNLMLNNTLIMSGTTGGDGSAAFIVVSTISYSVAVTDPATGLVWTTTLFPSDPTGLYTVWVGELPYASLGNTTLTYMNATRMYYTQPDIGNVTFHVDYQDISGYTTNVLFEVIDAGNMTPVYSVNLGAPGTGLLQANYTLPNRMGYTYYWGYNATRDTP